MSSEAIWLVTAVIWSSFVSDLRMIITLGSLLVAAGKMDWVLGEKRSIFVATKLLSEVRSVPQAFDGRIYQIRHENWRGLRVFWKGPENRNSLRFTFQSGQRLRYGLISTMTLEFDKEEVLGRMVRFGE